MYELLRYCVREILRFLRVLNDNGKKFKNIIGESKFWQMTPLAS